MKEKQSAAGRQTQIAYGVISLLLFVVLFFLPGLLQKEEKTVYEVVCLGDSIFAHSRDETSICASLQEYLGKSVLNGAFGGTTAARTAQDTGMSGRKGLLSLDALSQAIISSDFGPQRTLHIQDAGTDYFGEVVEELARADLAKAQWLILEYGTNDYFGGVALEDFYSAVCSSVKTFQKRYPKLRILIVSPNYNWLLSAEQSCEEWDGGGGLLEEYVEVLQRVSEETGCGFLDIYHDFYPHEVWEDWERYTVDGVHPNEAGRRKIAYRIYRYLTTE